MQFCLQNKKTKIEFEALNNNKFKILPISDARIFNFAIEKLKENAWYVLKLVLFSQAKLCIISRTAAVHLCSVLCNQPIGPHICTKLCTVFYFIILGSLFSYFDRVNHHDSDCYNNNFWSIGTVSSMTVTAAITIYDQLAQCHPWQWLLP